LYVNFKIDNYTEYVIFPFAFEEGIVKNILSTFYDANKEIIPNIYSSNIYKLDNNNKQIHLSLKNNNFKINFGSFYGEGIVKWGDYFKNQFFGQNMQRQIYKIPIKDQNTDITFQDRGDFIIYIKLMNLNVNRIFIFESNVNDFVQNEKFPLYYILRLEEENNDSIDINLKIINLNDKINGNDTKFDIEGSLINIFEYEGITKYDRQLRNSIKGEYDVCTKIGYLNIPIKLNNNTDNTNNTNNTKDNNYTNKIPYNFKKNIILIKISGINDNSNNNVFIQIFSMKQHSNLIIPNNQYIISYSVFLGCIGF